MPVKWVGKKSSKLSVLISGFVGKPSPNIQALLINTIIVILALYLFPIFPKFCEKTKRLITVFQKPRKKKVVPSAIPIVEKEEELYGEIHHSNKGIADFNHLLFQILKKELVEIFQSKRGAFHMKVTIRKSKERTRYALPDSHIKAN